MPARTARARGVLPCCPCRHTRNAFRGDSPVCGARKKAYPNWSHLRLPFAREREPSPCNRPNSGPATSPFTGERLPGARLRVCNPFRPQYVPRVGPPCATCCLARSRENASTVHPPARIAGHGREGHGRAGTEPVACEDLGSFLWQLQFCHLSLFLSQCALNRPKPVEGVTEGRCSLLREDAVCPSRKDFASKACNSSSHLKLRQSA